MQFAPLERPSYDAHVVATHYLYLGRVEPIGQFLPWLNDAQVHALPVIGPTCVSLEVGRDVQAGIGRMNLAKSDIVAMDLLSPAARQTEQLMQRKVPMTFTTELFCISGQCSLMNEIRPEDMLDHLKGPFVALTQATIRPIVNMRPLPFNLSALLILNTAHVEAFWTD